MSFWDGQTFNAVLKKMYDPNKIERLWKDEHAWFGMVKREPFPSYDVGMAVAPAMPLPSPAALMAITTLGALEFLRHRKADVARAEQDGTQQALVDEFFTWLRQLFRAMIEGWYQRGAQEDEGP